jgi:two-component system alkaline phosphatase synthesis response regulator PhoP
MNVPPRILVADDDDGLRQLMCMVLRREGFDVIEAVNGLDTLARAQDCDPTVILLDVMMPGMDGLDVCRNLKSDRRFDGVPVIFVSAIDDIQQCNETQQLGADECIKKPIGPRELVRRVQGVMERRGILSIV